MDSVGKVKISSSKAFYAAISNQTCCRSAPWGARWFKPNAPNSNRCACSVGNAVAYANCMATARTI